MWDAPKSIPSFFIGIILLALGLIPLLQQFGVIAFGLPGFLSGLISTLLFWILAAAGLYLIIDAFMEFDEPIGKIALLVGVMILAVGVLPILQQFGVIGFAVPLSPLIYNIIFVIEGILLVLSAFYF